MGTGLNRRNCHDFVAASRVRAEKMDILIVRFDQIILSATWALKGIFLPQEGFIGLVHVGLLTPYTQIRAFLLAVFDRIRNEE